MNKDNQTNESQNNEFQSSESQNSEFQSSEFQSSETPQAVIPMKTWKQVILGISLAVLFIVLFISTFISGYLAGVITIIEAAIIAVGTFIAVKFIRTNKKIAGIIILSVIAPMTLILLLIGSCFAIIAGNNFY